MKKLLVFLAILAVTASAHAQSWNYYKGINNPGGYDDSWGATPTVGSNGWTINQSGNSVSELGILWTSINALPTGAGVNLSFDLNSVNLPSPYAWGSGEFAGASMWTEVYIIDMASAGNIQIAKNCMAGTAGAWTDKMSAQHLYWNNYPTDPAPLQNGWHSRVSWVNGTAAPLNIWDGNTADKLINQTAHFSKSITSTSGNIFIGIKTGVYNSGVNQSSNLSYGQNVTGMQIQVLVPEPSSFLALGTGLFGMAGFVIRRRK